MWVFQIHISESAEPLLILGVSKKSLHDAQINHVGNNSEQGIYMMVVYIKANSRACAALACQEC